jgi:chaperonin GroES
MSFSPKGLSAFGTAFAKWCLFVIVNKVWKTIDNRRAAKMKIRPLGDKVIVQRLEADAITAGGIVLPESAKEKPQRGKIVSVGDGKQLDDGSRAKMSVKKGQEVLFTSYAGTEVKVANKELLIMDESDILAIVE